MAWTDANVDALKALWGDGRTAQEIAEKLGMTRNAVIGKANRLGLADAETPNPGRYEKPGQRSGGANYPGLGLDAAKKIDEARRAGGTPPDIGSFVLRKEGAEFDDATAADCLNQCNDLLIMIEDEGQSHARFDAQCAPLLHANLNLPERIAGDGDFWRWFTFARDCQGADIVDWRYGRKSTSDGPDVGREVYYGLETMKKGMFSKLWICANAMYVDSAGNPYDGIEYADVDLWDSHVVDVDYASSHVMARAFVKTVRDRKLPRGEPNRADAPAGFRDLAKEIRRRQATIAFELFDEGQARAWIEYLWSERELWLHKR